MDWGKKNTKKYKQSEKHEANNEYKGIELQCYRNAVLGIAAAVIKQWIDDGCPKEDDVSLFSDIITHYTGKKLLK